MSKGGAGERQVFLIDARSAGAPGGSAERMGFKAWNLARMAGIGLPVPPAFVLETGFCREHFRGGGVSPEQLRELLAQNMRWLEQASGLAFGGARKLLLVSVRSGAAQSMPGMMDTLLDVGLNDATVRSLIRATGKPRLAWDCYRRLVQGFAEVVCKAPKQPFVEAVQRRVREAGVDGPQELDFAGLAALAAENLELYRELAGEDFPQNPMDQLERAVRAVLESWMSPRAVEYRRIARLPEAAGTAVTVQRMVFGNAGGASGAGVAFTRDPASGENALYLDFLFDAQGEDVVSGRQLVQGGDELAARLPRVREQIATAGRALEKEFRAAQDFEFTVQDGELFLLQTRTAACAPWATLRIAVEQVREGLITPAIALKRLESMDLERIRRVRIKSTGGAEALCGANVASAGVASGAIALDEARAREFAAAGRRVIFVAAEIATGDIGAIAAADGVLTATGGQTSHAAVLARQLDKVCLVGCRELAIDRDGRGCSIARRAFGEGDVICLDADSGRVFAGEPEIVIERPLEYLAEVAAWRARQPAVAAEKTA